MSQYTTDTYQDDLKLWRGFLLTADPKYLTHIATENLKTFYRQHFGHDYDELIRELVKEQNT